MWLFLAAPPTHSFETCSKRSSALKEYNRVFNLKIFFFSFFDFLKNNILGTLVTIQALKKEH